MIFLVVISLGGCGGGGGGGGGGNGNGAGDPGGGGGTVTISGKAQYEFPPPVPNCNGLNFDDIERRPIRQATIRLLDAATDAVLEETVTDDNGDYAFTIAADTSVYVRVRAELKRAGTPSWDVEVRDNVTTAEPPVALELRPLYVLDGAPFNSGGADQARDITATTGWGGTSYTGTRAAAPFAILDSVYNGMLLVLARDPQIGFEPLDVFWSVNNTATAGEQDIDAGELGTSFYRSDNKLFLLGMDGLDTEEFDDHVIVHEWGHYFEDSLSRSDSIGGAHAIGDRLDMRVAFSEGFATAYSGMALDNALYCDTLGPLQASGFGIDIEGQSPGTPPGWFNEISVMKLIYDLWDTDDDGADSDSIGFGPIYDVMTGAQSVTPALTSIFSFAEALKAENPAEVPFIDALLQAEDIVASGINAYGDGETNDGQGGASDVLPVYTTVVPDDSTINICSNSQFDANSDGNKLSEQRFLRMTIDTAVPYTFSIITTTDIPGPDDPEDPRDQSDPDILILRNGVVQNQVVDGARQGQSGEANQEIFTTPDALPVGDYAMTLVEFRYQDEDSPEDYPAQTCFDVTVTPAP